MIVDDEPMITTTLATLIRLMMKQAVSVFNDPREALRSELLLAGDIDLILSDFLMPGMNGVEFLRRAKELSPNAIAVMLTGYADKENAIRSINEVGLYYYIEKPWDNASLVRILQNGLEKRDMEEREKHQRQELEVSNDKIIRLYERLQQDYSTERKQAVGILSLLADAVEAHDQYSIGHVYRVSSFCRLIGQKMDLSPERLETLFIAGELHDIGKVATSDLILTKPGKLTQEEFEIMKRHSAEGEKLLKPLASLKECLDPIRHHHEKLDGSGYPDGLKGDGISLESRILSVVDIFDALHTTRPYRGKLSMEQARGILSEECERGQLDAEVVEVLFSVLDSGEADAILALMR